MEYEKVIDTLCGIKNQRIELQYLTSISSYVDHAFITLDYPRSYPNHNEFFKMEHEIYLLKKFPMQEAIYIGIVLVMESDVQGDDLHGYVFDNNRKLGHMKNALKDVILPHIFEKKEIQRVTVDEDKLGEYNYNSSASLALKLGFESKDKYEFFLTKEKFEKNIVNTIA